MFAKLFRFTPASYARRRVSKIRPIKESKQIDRCIYLDVSVLIRNDAGTGIQRVVRGVWRELKSNPPKGFKVFPVYATRKTPYKIALTDRVLNSDPTASLHEGDVFLGLDWSANILTANESQLYQWKRNGVKIAVVVYDCLPFIHPEWFPEATSKKFKRWMKTLAVYANSILCISGVVKEDVDKYMHENMGLNLRDIPSFTFPLGADFSNSKHSYGITEDEQEWINLLDNQKYVVQVGTIEPRKGHEDVLDAFSIIWQSGSKYALVFVGRPGWKTESLQNKIRTHPEYLKRLFWFDNASDDVLDWIYKHCSGVAIASKSEGFGLPLIEASVHNKPVFARNIPVFREIAESGVTFFSSEHPNDIAFELSKWITEVSEQKTLMEQPNVKLSTWAECSEEIGKIILNL